VIEYIYKGFKISYKIARAELEKNTYKADGSVSYLLNMPKTFAPKKFHTEYDTHAGAEHEIKKLLENYVNFELKNFYDMQKESGQRTPEQAVR
jgi:hypothetical protein